MFFNCIEIYLHCCPTMSLRNLRRQGKKVLEGSLFLWGVRAWKWGEVMDKSPRGLGTVRVMVRGLICRRISYEGFGDFVLS